MIVLAQRSLVFDSKASLFSILGQIWAWVSFYLLEFLVYICICCYGELQFSYSYYTKNG